MPQQTVPPTMMLRSFLTVGSGYISQWMLWAIFSVAIGTSFFPAFNAYFELDEAAQVEAMASDPWNVTPPLMFWMVTAATVLGSIGVGWFVFKTAPFAQFSHAIFVAVLVFINHLQMLISDSPAKKTMTMVYMVAFPIAIIVGARMARGKLIEVEEPESQEDEINSNHSRD